MAQNIHRNRKQHFKERIIVGDKVCLKQDHYRLPDLTPEEKERLILRIGLYGPLQDEHRTPELYASAGDQGVLLYTFHDGTGFGEKILYAQLLMTCGAIKTFRFTSIELAPKE